MTAESPTIDLRGLVPAALGAAGLATGGVMLFVVLYAARGPGFVERLPGNVGEVMMEEAIRFDRAGLVEDARTIYEAALRSRFQGPHNRVYTAKRLGTLLWGQGELDQAVVYLQQAATSPYAPVSVHEPLCDTLIRLGRNGEAEAAIQGWRNALPPEPDPAVLSAIQYHLGRLALGQGDPTAAETHFREGNVLVPGGRNASELGDLFFVAHRYEDAVAFYDLYLRRGASGDRARRARHNRTAALLQLGRGGEAGHQEQNGPGSEPPGP